MSEVRQEKFHSDKVLGPDEFISFRWRVRDFSQQLSGAWSWRMSDHWRSSFSTGKKNRRKPIAAHYLLQQNPPSALRAPSPQGDVSDSRLKEL